MKESHLRLHYPILVQNQSFTHKVRIVMTYLVVLNGLSPSYLFKK